MIRRFLGFLITRLLGAVPSDKMVRILASHPVDARGVLNIPWGSTRTEILQSAPASVVDAVLSKPGRNPDILQGSGSLEGHSATLTFLLNESGFYSLSVAIRQRCPSLNENVSALYGPPVHSWPMPGWLGKPEIHTLWVREGFEIVTEVNEFDIGIFVLQVPTLSTALKDVLPEARGHQDGGRVREPGSTQEGAVNSTLDGGTIVKGIYGLAYLADVHDPQVITSLTIDVPALRAEDARWELFCLRAFAAGIALSRAYEGSKECPELLDAFSEEGKAMVRFAGWNDTPTHSLEDRFTEYLLAYSSSREYVRGAEAVGNEFMRICRSADQVVASRGTLIFRRSHEAALGFIEATRAARRDA